MLAQAASNSVKALSTMNTIHGEYGLSEPLFAHAPHQAALNDGFEIRNDIRTTIMETSSMVDVSCLVASSSAPRTLIFAEAGAAKSCHLDSLVGSDCQSDLKVRDDDQRLPAADGDPRVRAVLCRAIRLFEDCVPHAGGLRTLLTDSANYGLPAAHAALLKHLMLYYLAFHQGMMRYNFVSHRASWAVLYLLGRLEPVVVLRYVIDRNRLASCLTKPQNEIPLLYCWDSSRPFRSLADFGTTFDAVCEESYISSASSSAGFLLVKNNNIPSRKFYYSSGDADISTRKLRDAFFGAQGSLQPTLTSVGRQTPLSVPEGLENAEDQPFYSENAQGATTEGKVVVGLFRESTLNEDARDVEISRRKLRDAFFGRPKTIPHILPGPQYRS